jgi:hypothetical protein
MEKMVEVINSSTHIDFLLHGIYHGYYKEGVDNHDSSDYFYRINKKLFRISEEEIVERLDAFFQIMQYHNINKKVNQFIPPSGTYRQGDLSEIFKRYGIIYATPVFRAIEKITDDVTDFVYTENGFTVIDRNNCIVPWDEVGTNFLALPDCNGIFGTHWPNFLHEDPSRNHEVVANAAAYINRCCSRFDTAPAEDISVCAMQQLILKYGKIEYISEVDIMEKSVQSKIDAVWNTFFAGGVANPLTVIEQITYLLFMKALDEVETNNEQTEQLLGVKFNRIFDEDHQDCRWSKFKNMSAPEMFKTVSERVFPFIKNLQPSKESSFSKYMESAIFVVPTALVLEKVVTQLDSIPMKERDTKGDIYEYMLSKLSTSGDLGQFRTPRHIIRMMVELIKPTPNDTICDPACGSGGFLVEAGEYLREEHKDLFNTESLKHHYNNSMNSRIK